MASPSREYPPMGPTAVDAEAKFEAYRGFVNDIPELAETFLNGFYRKEQELRQSIRRPFEVEPISQRVCKHLGSQTSILE